MHHAHDGMTFTLPVKAGRMTALQEALRAIREQDEASPVIPFAKSPSTHFVTMAILPEASRGRQKLEALLIIMTSFSGPTRQHIREMVEHWSEGLHSIFKETTLWKANEPHSQKAIRRCLRRSKIRNTCYSGYQYIGTEDAQREQGLRDLLNAHLNTAIAGDPAFIRQSPSELHRTLRNFIAAKADFSWALKKRSRFRGILSLYGPLMIVAAVFVLLLGLSVAAFWVKAWYTLAAPIVIGAVLLFLLAMLLTLRVNEKQDHPLAERPTDERIFDIVSREKGFVVNEMTVSGPLKRGWIRPIFLFVTLRLVFLFRGLTTIPTVHTARWLQTNGGKRIVFIAYYENTSEGYAHDFVDSTVRTRNLNLIFGNGNGFPATKWAVIGGGENRQGYIDAVREQQIITEVWYYTHPTISVTNLNNNRDIYHGLAMESMSDQEAQQWLDKIY